MPLSYRYPFFFLPRPGTFEASITPDYINAGNAGTAFSASATVNPFIHTPNRRCIIRDALIQCGPAATMAATGSAAITVQLIKQLAAGSTQALTAATSVKNDVLTSATFNKVAITITATDAQCVLEPGDALYWALVAAGTVTQQPTLLLGVEYGIIR